MPPAVPIIAAAAVSGVTAAIGISLTAGFIAFATPAKLGALIDGKMK